MMAQWTLIICRRNHCVITCFESHSQVAQENAERKKSLEYVTHEWKCSYFKLDPRKVMRDMMPFCVNGSTGQWYGLNMKPIPTPPSHVSAITVVAVSRPQQMIAKYPQLFDLFRTGTHQTAAARPADRHQ